MNLNKLWMKLIKESDRNITFIGFVTQNKEEFVKVVVKNELGGKDTVVFKILSTSPQMRSNEWEHIRSTVKNKTYLEKNDSETNV